MVDLNSIAGTLRTQAGPHSTIVLDSTVLPAAELDRLRVAFVLGAGADLTIAGVAPAAIPAPVNGSLTISGGTATVLKQDGVGISLTFSAPSGSLEVTIVATMGSAWKFTDSFPALDTFPFQELTPFGACFVYTTAAQTDFPWPGAPSGTISLEPGLNFLSHVTFNNFSVISSLLGVLINATPVKFYGPFAPGDPRHLPVGTLRAPLGKGTFGIGVAPNGLSLADPAVAVRIGAPEADTSIQEIDLLVEADFNNVLRFSVGVPVTGGTLAIVTEPLQHNASINTLIEGLPGGQGFMSYIPGELTNIFANVGLDSFTMVVDPTPRVSFLGLAISTLQPWTVIQDVLVLEGLHLRIESVDPAGQAWTRIFLAAEASFLPKTNIFPGKFDFTVGLEKQTSWVVSSISGIYFGRVNLGDIVGGLLGNQNSVPAALRAISFSDFGATATRIGTGTPATYTYAFFGGVEVAFPILERELLASLTLAVTKTPTSYAIHLSGGLSIGEETFALTLDLGTAGATLSATWTDTGTPLGFADVAMALGWDDMPPIPENLDLSLTKAGFYYDFDKASLTLTATSTHGQIVFVTEIVNGKRMYLLDLSVVLNISLSDIPVAGQQIPKEIDVGISDLEVAYASAPLMAGDVDAINVILGKIGAHNLGPPAFAQGMGFFGTLRLGTDTQPLTLPLGQPSSPPPALTATTATPPATYQASGKWFDIGKSFGPLRIDRIGVQYENSTLIFALDAGISFGPLGLSMQGLGIGTPLTKVAPVFSLSGLGLSYNKPPLEILGAILRVPDDQLAAGVAYQFDGTLVLKAAQFSLSAIGSYAQLKSGAPSLFVFAQLETPLGGPPAFFVTGLMAGFGFNRALAIPAQDEVLNFPLLTLGQSSSPDPMHVLQVLEGSVAPPSGPAKAWITPQAGEFWLAAGVRFTSFELVSTKAILIVEFGNDLQIALLGLSTMQLPQPAESSQTYAYVEMMIRVVIQPDLGFFAATAILSKNSYVLTPDCHLTGGFAFYLWFGKNPNAGEFVVTLGGYHPAFLAPDYYPQVPRLGFNWAVSDVVSIKGEAYFALTPSCIMAGGGLEVLFHDGDLQAWFTAHADFLVSWHPFFYVAEIAFSIGVSYRLNLLVCHKTITVSIGADLNLWGPPTGGTVRVDLVVVSFTVHFGSDGAGQERTPLPWKEFQALLPKADTICRIAVSDGLYKTRDAATNSSGKLWVVRAKQFSFQTRSAIPASHLTYGDSTTPVASAPAGGIAIKPMNHSGVRSTHKLSIFRDKATTPEAGPAWKLASVTETVPDSLWGAPPDPFSQIPAVPEAKVIDGQLCGISATAPPPAIGDTRGVIALTELKVEELSPAGQAPLFPGVQESPDYLPSFNEHTIGLIQQVMDTSAKQNRDGLHKVLADVGLYSGVNGDLSLLAAGAGHLCGDSPMQQN